MGRGMGLAGWAELDGIGMKLTNSTRRKNTEDETIALKYWKLDSRWTSGN